MRAALLIPLGAAAAITGSLVWLIVSLGPAAPARWTITHRVSAHRALVIEVETRHPEEAAEIARAIGDPEQPRFTEILVYFHHPGRRDMLRRVQWTREHGYVETVYP